MKDLLVIGPSHHTTSGIKKAAQARAARVVVRSVTAKVSQAFAAREMSLRDALLGTERFIPGKVEFNASWIPPR